MTNVGVFRGSGMSSTRGGHASAIAVKLRRLNNHDERNLVAQGTLVAMNIELRHYKVVCSSAKEPTVSCTAFQSATQTSASCWRLRCALC